MKPAVKDDLVGTSVVLIVAFASATQDILIDAYRVESLTIREQAAGMAGYVAAYRIGMLVSGAGVIGLTAWLEAKGMARFTGEAFTVEQMVERSVAVYELAARALRR